MSYFRDYRYGTIDNYGYTNNGTVTASAFQTATNAMANGTDVNFATSETTTNMAGAVALTSISGFNATGYNWKIIHMMNRSGADRAVTGGAGWIKLGGSGYVTNNSGADVLVQAQIGLYTNWTMIP